MRKKKKGRRRKKNKETKKENWEEDKNDTNTSIVVLQYDNYYNGNLQLLFSPLCLPQWSPLGPPVPADCTQTQQCPG